MIAVDTSVWIDFFRDRASREVDCLVDAIRDGRASMLDLVLTEVLQGCDTDREFRQVQFELAPHHLIEVMPGQVPVLAARHYRTLRARGITIRKTIDTLIATRCIFDDMPLLYSDRDFDPFVQHLGLRSALDIYGEP